MHVTALPGRRSETEVWLRSLLVAAGLPEASVVRYRHWDTDFEASVAFEAARLANQAPQLVIAKSLGTVIAATAFCLHEFRPAAAVLIGTPYAALDGGGLDFLRQFAAGVETLFIQQSEDPGGSAGQLPAALRLARGEIAAVPGGDHLYSDTTALATVLHRWRQQQPGL